MNYQIQKEDSNLPALCFQPKKVHLISVIFMIKWRENLSSQSYQTIYPHSLNGRKLLADPRKELQKLLKSLKQRYLGETQNYLTAAAKASEYSIKSMETKAEYGKIDYHLATIDGRLKVVKPNLSKGSAQTTSIEQQAKRAIKKLSAAQKEALLMELIGE